MKSTHGIKKIDRDILVLDDNSVWRADAMTTSKLMFWASYQKVEVVDSTMGATITNLSRHDSIKATKVA